MKYLDVLSPLMQKVRHLNCYKCGGQFAAEINVKPPLLRQALLNILNTAIQCSSPNSQVEITAATEASQIVHVSIETMIMRNVPTSYRKIWQRACGWRRN